jgi:hypothetical protein
MDGQWSESRRAWRASCSAILVVMLALPAVLQAQPSPTNDLVRPAQMPRNVDSTLPGIPAHPNLADAGPQMNVSSMDPVQDWITPRLPPYHLRHISRGDPLHGTSWLNRPTAASVFIGSWLGDTLITDDVRQASASLAGFRLGQDLSHFWGTEFRFGLANGGLEYVSDTPTNRECRNLVADVHLLYYPWGDSRWRPFASVGAGIAGFHFVDPDGYEIDQTIFHMPFGFGLKYLWRRSFVFRFDATDNLSFGTSGLHAMHNWSLTGGVEYRWGAGSHARYFPW